MNSNFKKASSGLSLIETMLGLSIITLAVSAMVGVAIYTFSTYHKSIFRFTALSLAQEGTEVARNIRDANWLPPNTITYCGDSGQQNYIGPEQYCYAGWLTNLTGCAAGCQAVFDPSINTWALSTPPSYALYLQNTGVYTPAASGTARFYRKIKITQNTAAPYSEVHPELKVVSIVAWVGRGCINNFSGDPENASAQCKITVEDRLTNWKNY